MCEAISKERWQQIIKEPLICKCGCGEQIIFKKYHRYGGIPSYINGHYTRTKEFKKAIQIIRSDKNSPYNSKEYRKKIGMGGKNRVNTLEYINKLRLSKLGKKNPNFGKIPKHLKDIHKNWKARDPEGYIQHQRNAGKKAFYACPRISKQELIIQDFLKNLNIKFETQFDFKEGIADILIHPNFIICVDGDFWHGNPKKFPKNKLSERQIGTKEKDIRQRKYLESQGYIVKQLWEMEINELTLENFESLLNFYKRDKKGYYYIPEVSKEKK